MADNNETKIARTGRPKGTEYKAEYKRKNRTFKVNDVEWEKINENAKRAGKPTGKFIRERALMD
jgi:hypothetical protein